MYARSRGERLQAWPSSYGTTACITGSGLEALTHCSATALSITAHYGFVRKQTEERRAAEKYHSVFLRPSVYLREKPRKRRKKDSFTPQPPNVAHRITAKPQVNHQGGADADVGQVNRIHRLRVALLEQ